MQEKFKGLIFPKPVKIKDEIVYRYQICGLLITSKPIPEFEGKNEILLEGSSYLSDLLPGIRHRECNLGMSPEDFLVSMAEVKF